MYTSNIWMGRVTCLKESYHTYQSVMSRGPLQPSGPSVHIYLHIYFQVSFDVYVGLFWHAYEYLSAALSGPSVVCIDMSNIWMGRVACMKESYHRYQSVMSRKSLQPSGPSHMWMYMSNIWIGHVTCMNESYHTYQLVKSRKSLQPECCVCIYMSHTWMSHVTYMNESYHTYQ